MKRKWNFKREVSLEMIHAVNTAYEKKEWIRQYLDDSELFLAIRNGYMNFYYCGNNILKLNYKSGLLDGDVHYKYLLRPFLTKESKSDQPYVSISEEITLPMIDPKQEHASKWIKKASKPYSGVEKEGLAKVINANNNIVDLEVSFQRENDDGEIDIRKQDRIDFCALRKNSADAIELCFYEAKHFSNKELKAEGEPKVVAQIRRYNKNISNHKQEILAAYQQTFKNILELNTLHPAHQYIQSALTEGFSISEDVRLVIFGFDQIQKDALETRTNHLIEHGLKKELILMKGNSKDFCMGISK